MREERRSVFIRVSGHSIEIRRRDGSRATFDAWFRDPLVDGPTGFTVSALGESDDRSYPIEEVIPLVRETAEGLIREYE